MVFWRTGLFKSFIENFLVYNKFMYVSKHLVANLNVYTLYCKERRDIMSIICNTYKSIQLTGMFHLISYYPVQGDILRQQHIIRVIIEEI